MNRAFLLSVMVMFLLAASLVPYTQASATKCEINDISIEEEPINDTTVKVTAMIDISVDFSSPGEYIVLIENASTGDILAKSFRYKVGSVSYQWQVTLKFNRPSSPGVYEYAAVIKAEDSSSGWFVADRKTFTISVPQPKTITTATTVTDVETVTKALEYLKTITTTTTKTTTVMNATTSIHMTALTILRTFTKKITITKTLTETKPFTKKITVTKTLTETKLGLPKVDNLPDMVSMGIFIAIIFLLLAAIVAKLRR